MDKLCVDQLCVSKLCVSKLCVNKLCVNKLCVNKLCVDKLCVVQLCVSKLCVDKLCVDKLCVDKLCGDKLCVRKLCVDKLCGHKLCVDKLCGDKLCVRRRRRAASGSGARRKCTTKNKNPTQRCGESPTELLKLNLKHYHMSTELFKRRRSALKLPKEIYDKYDQITKSCDTCFKAKIAPSRAKVSGIRSEVFGELTFH